MHQGAGTTKYRTSSLVEFLSPEMLLLRKDSLVVHQQVWGRKQNLCLKRNLCLTQTEYKVYPLIMEPSLIKDLLLITEPLIKQGTITLIPKNYADPPERLNYPKLISNPSSTRNGNLMRRKKDTTGLQILKFPSLSPTHCETKSVVKNNLKGHKVIITKESGVFRGCGIYHI